MVKVNLLKPGSGGVKGALALSFPAGKLSKVLYLLSLLFALAAFFLMLRAHFQKTSLYKVSSEYRQAEKVKEEIKALTKEKEGLTGFISLLSGYARRNIAWSAKLDSMRLLIPKDAWLTQLSFGGKYGKESGYSFDINGGLISGSKTGPIAILSSFVNQLKTDKAFSEDFGMPVLTDLRSQNQEGIEAMAFSIEMPLKAGRAP